MTIRDENWFRANNKSFDVAVIGGGINGASIYKRLRSEGYRVFLFDKGDFSCGSSQASAMMIWGGLLYLQFVGEAFAFCDDYIKKYKQPIPVWPDLDFTHGGSEGNYKKFLMGKIEEEEKTTTSDAA